MKYAGRKHKEVLWNRAATKTINTNGAILLDSINCIAIVQIATAIACLKPEN